LAYRWTPAGKTKYLLRYGTGFSPTETVLGQVPLLCIVNFWNPVEAVGSAALEAVWRGEITNWSVLGGEDRPIEVLTYNRPDLPRLPGTDRPGLRQVRSQEAMVAAVRDNPNAIGVITWPVLSPAVKVLTVDGVNPAWTREPLTPLNYPYWTVLTLTEPRLSAGQFWLSGGWWRRWRFRRELAASFSPAKNLGGQTAFTLAAAGDMMFSRRVAATSISQGDYRYPFRKVAPVLLRATLAMANLEGPLSDQGKQLNMFRGDPRFLEGIRYAGIDLVSLANNHIMDYGTVAFLDTMERLTAAGVMYVGAGTNLAKARQGRLLNLGGVKVGFLAYTELGPGFTYTREPQHWAATNELPGVAPARPEYLQEDIARLKTQADLVVVSIHWGQEHQHYPTAKQQHLGRTALAAGADLVVGHHPHVLQGLAVTEEGIIAYSLGNFIFDQKPEATRQGLLLEVAGDRYGIRQLRCVPLLIENEQPQLVEGEAARRIMHLLRTISQGL
ncbi:MAG TPA: hypothetical protein GXX33_03690, partial [Firmicutes bacterium]|nr:hypothetical protein [Bacillota bacterium]